MTRIYTPDYVFDAVSRVLSTLLPYFERTPGGVGDGLLYGQYRRDVRGLLADPRAAARSSTLAQDIASIAAGYRMASSDLRAVIVGLERLVVASRTIVPTAARSSVLKRQRENEQALALLVEVIALAEIALAVSDLRFRSYEEASTLRQRLSRTFDIAIERASDQRAVDSQRALRAAQVAMVRDIIERGRPLARIVNYETAVPLPAAVLAHRYYQDAGRTGELIAENSDTDHPAFMPVAGRAYSR